MRHVAVALALATTIAACSENATEPSADFSGNYILRTINGQGLPFVAVQGDITLELLSAAIEVTDNGTNAGSFTLQVHFRVTQSGEVWTQTDTDGGSYSRNGTVATFRHDDGSVETGTIDGTTWTFTQTSAGVAYAFVFRK